MHRGSNLCLAVLFSHASRPCKGQTWRWRNKPTEVKIDIRHSDFHSEMNDLQGLRRIDRHPNPACMTIMNVVCTYMDNFWAFVPAQIGNLAITHPSPPRVLCRLPFASPANACLTPTKFPAECHLLIHLLPSRSKLPPTASMTGPVPAYYLVARCYHQPSQHRHHLPSPEASKRPCCPASSQSPSPTTPSHH